MPRSEPNRSMTLSASCGGADKSAPLEYANQTAPLEQLECGKVSEIGSCVPGSFTVKPHCAVRLDTGYRLNAISPVMLGDDVCRKGDGYWFYRHGRR